MLLSPYFAVSVVDAKTHFGAIRQHSFFSTEQTCLLGPSAMFLNPSPRTQMSPLKALD